MQRTPGGVRNQVTVGSLPTTLEVDGALHLTKVGSVSNTFDAAENPTKIAEPGGSTVTQTFDDAGQQVTRTSGSTVTDFEFDADGRRTGESVGSADTASYAYDDRGRLSSLQTSDRGGSLVDQSFAYGPSGDRFSTTRGGLTKFESWEDALGGPASLLTHGRSAYVYGPGGMPLEFIDHDGSASYLWQDAIGSIIGTTSTSGAVSATFAYDTWGRRTAGFGSQAGVLGFAGQVTEPGLDLQYLRARYYDPKTASFLTRDPQEATTRQPYLYAAGNPTMFTDPTGEAPELRNALGGVAHGMSFGLYKSKWADSCSWWYFAGAQVGSIFDPIKRIRAVGRLAKQSVHAFAGAGAIAAAAVSRRLSQKSIPREYGPFHRIAATHTKDEMKQARAGTLKEVRGGTNQHGFERSVDAYEGPLPKGTPGYEFYTTVKPRPGTRPGLAQWREGQAGVDEVDDSLVAIPCRLGGCR